MRNATPLRPRERPPRSTAEVRRWRERREEWFATLDPSGAFQRLFDHIPGVSFFAKDRDGHLMFASHGLLQRYQMPDDSEFIGLTDFDLNPGSMARAYVDDDKRLLRKNARIVERIELWWDRQGIPDWFLVTKLPLHDRQGKVQGVMGLLRRPDPAERKLPVFQTVAQAVEIIRRDFAGPLLIEQVAKSCGQSLRQLQRRFQSAFGITPQEFLLKTRVLAAARLIEETSLTTSEIAQQCGFVDASSFAQHFRKRIGFAPSVVRRRLRAGGDVVPLPSGGEKRCPGRDRRTRRKATA
jgi:AraC-like DNA-binding protein